MGCFDKYILNLFRKYFRVQCAVCKEWKKKKDITGFIHFNKSYKSCKICNGGMVRDCMQFKKQKDADDYWRELEKKVTT